MLAFQPLPEPLPGAGTQVQCPEDDAHGAGCRDARKHVVEHRHGVGQVRHDRHQEHRHGESGFGRRPHRVQARLERRCTGLECLPQPLVGHGDRHREVNGHATPRLREHRQVAAQQRALGEHRERRSARREGIDDLGHEPITPLGALIRVGVGAERHRLPLPRRRGQFAAQYLGHVDLHDDLLVEIAPGVEVEVGVGAPCEAVRAGVAAATVRVHRPVERHRGCRGHMIQRRLGRHLVEGHPGELRGRDGADQAVEALHAGQGSGIRCIDTLSTPPHAVHSNRDTTNAQRAGVPRARRAE